MGSFSSSSSSSSLLFFFFSADLILQKIEKCSPAIHPMNPPSDSVSHTSQKVTFASPSIFRFLLFIVTLLLLILVSCMNPDELTPPSLDDNDPPISLDSSPPPASGQCFPLSGIERDACLLDAIIDGVRHQFEGVEAPSCGELEDTHLQYGCNRLLDRFHMADIMTSRLTQFPPSLPSVAGCDQADPFYRIYCLHSQASRDARASPDGLTERVCSTLGTERFRGECEFYVAVDLAPEFRDDPEKTAQTLMEYCARIEDGPWRSECYFMIADELALRRPIAYLEGIAPACRLSTEAMDYFCFHHVAMLMPVKEGRTYCGLVEEDYQSFCFDGLGSAVAKEMTDDFIAAVDTCASFPEIFVGNCIDGLGWNTAWRSQEQSLDVDELQVLFPQCALAPPEYVERCEVGFGAAVGRRFIEDVTLGTEACGLFPDHVRLECLHHLGWSVGTYRFDTAEKTVARCRSLPEPAWWGCFEGTMRSIVERSDEAGSGIADCAYLPDDNQVDNEGGESWQTICVSRIEQPGDLFG